jgi:hypothetical protein
MARRYLQQSSFSSFNNITLRDVPKMLMNSDSVRNMFDDLFSNSTLFNSIPKMTALNMTSTGLYYMVETKMNQLPYDAYGIDAQMSLGKYQTHVSKKSQDNQSSYCYPFLILLFKYRFE